MKLIVFGASGMVGQGVVREALLDPTVTEVLAVTRSPLGRDDPKLRAIVHEDFSDFSTLEKAFRGAAATFFCLGVSAVGMTEADYTRVTFDITTAAARSIAKAASGSAFVYVSGAGTDSSEKGRAMWARVKGRTENAILGMSTLRGAMFRPGFIQPVHGARSRTGWYRAFYAVTKPVGFVTKKIAPGAINTTADVGKAMLRVAKEPGLRGVFAARDISRLSRGLPLEKT